MLRFEIDPHRAFPGRGMLVGCAPFALLFPRIGEAPDSKVSPLPQAEALGRILHACARVASEHLPGRAQQLQLLGRLVASSRAFDVAVGNRILTDPSAVIDDLRERLG